MPEKYIELNAFLKLKGFATSGGRAKLLIQSGRVLVNGVPETQNKKKLIEDDSVECNGQKFKVKKEECRMEKKDKKNEKIS